MFRLDLTTQFKKDVKIAKKRSGEDIELLRAFLKKLEQNGVEAIEKNYKPHKLKGKYNNNWEAHIKPDFLIIWLEIRNEKEILLLRLGSHSDLF